MNTARISALTSALLLAVMPSACGEDDGDAGGNATGGAGGERSSTGGSSSGGNESSGGARSSGGSDSGGAGAGGEEATGGTGGMAVVPPARGDITVRLHAKGTEPVGGFPVQYNAADGTHIETLTTTTHGTVVFKDVLEGGSVTALIDRQPTRATLQTRGGTKANTTVHLGTEREIVGEFALTFSGEPVGGASYQASSTGGAGRGSGGPGGSWTGKLYDVDLTASGTTSYYGYVIGGSDQPLGYGVLADVAPTGTAPALTLTDALDTWSTDFGRVSATFVSRETNLVEIDGTLIGLRANRRFGSMGDFFELATDESAEVTIAVTEDFHDGASAYMDLYGPGDEYERVVAVGVNTIPANGTTTNVTVETSRAYPLLDAASFDADTLEVTTGFSAASSCGGIAPDIVDVRLQGTATIAAESTDLVWNISLPYSDSVAPPELDPVLAALAWPEDAEATVASVSVVGLGEGDASDAIALDSRRSFYYLLPGDRCETRVAFGAGVD